MPVRHPAIEPYASGLLDVGNGNRVYWQAVGDPAGRPAVFLHGGPGSGCTVNERRLSDPRRYNAVLIDRRGCRRSLPPWPSTAPISRPTPHRT